MINLEEPIILWKMFFYQSRPFFPVKFRIFIFRAITSKTHFFISPVKAKWAQGRQKKKLFIKTKQGLEMEYRNSSMRPN